MANERSFQNITNESQLSREDKPLTSLIHLNNAFGKDLRRAHTIAQQGREQGRGHRLEVWQAKRKPLEKLKVGGKTSGQVVQAPM